MHKKEFFIDSDYSNVAKVCKEISSFLNSKAVERKAVRDLELCMIESLNNVIKHAYNSEAGNPINISLSITKETVEIKIIDSGNPRKNLKKPVLDYDPKDIENLPEGGMGLYVIDQLMDENFYEILADKNIFTLVKELG